MKKGETVEPICQGDLTEIICFFQVREVNLLVFLWDLVSVPARCSTGPPHLLSLDLQSMQELSVLVCKPLILPPTSLFPHKIFLLLAVVFAPVALDLGSQLESELWLITVPQCPP